MDNYSSIDGNRGGGDTGGGGGLGADGRLLSSVCMIGYEVAGLVMVNGFADECGSRCGGERGQVGNNCTIAHSHLCQCKDNFCARVIGQKPKKAQIAQWHKIAKTSP